MKRNEKKRPIPCRVIGWVILCFCCVWAVQCFAFADDTESQMVDGRELQVLRDYGIYTVAYSENYSPFSYTDVDGKAAGIAIDLMNYVAQIAQVDVEYITVTEAERYHYSVDINMAIAEADQLAYVTRSSSTYASLQMMLVTKQLDTNITRGTIGHLPYHVLEEGTIESALTGCTVRTYASYGDMVEAFQAGSLDGMLVTSLVASQMAETANETELYVMPTDVKLNLFLSYGDDMPQEVMDAFDNLIISLDEDYIYSMMLSSVITASHEEMTTMEVLEAYAVPLLVFVLLVLMVIAIIVFCGDYAKQKLLEETLHVDELTGMMTERKFTLEANNILQKAKPGEYYIITTDIDNFKFINEIYGYSVGSQAIKLYGEMLQSIFPKNTVIARLFADNFVIFYKNVVQIQDDYEEIYRERISHTMETILGENYRLTTSAGIYQVDDVTLPLSYMIDCANVVRRQGKRRYGITSVLFTRELEDSIRLKKDIVLSMEAAIREKEFKIYYQPKISLKTGEMVGAEALIRWVRPDGERRYPDSFIPLFESNGFIVKVDYFVLETVCEFLEQHPEVPKISVNFSGHTVLRDNMIDQVQAIIRTYGVPAKRLEIEITESAVVKNFEPIVKQTARLKQMGFTISMDDFGAGISSLNRLKDMDIDVLKIDKAFLGEGTLNERGISIMEHIVAMARNLKITTVAEGVEHDQQVKFLKSLGCDVVQGYYYGKPMAEADYLEFIRNYKPQILKDL